MSLSFEAVAGFLDGPDPLAGPLPDGPDVLMPQFTDGRLRPRLDIPAERPAGGGARPRLPRRRR